MERNLKLLNANQKEPNKALSNYNLIIIDDEDDSVLVKNDAYKHSSIYDDLIDKNISEFLDDDEMFKNIVEKMILVGRQYAVKDKDELKSLINKSIEVFGNKCDLNWINTSLITDMAELFYNMKDFNGYIDKWNTSNVEDMSYMFQGAQTFNHQIGKWNVSKVKEMHYMFYQAKSFNQPIGNWDVHNVEDMQYMFFNALSFNQPLENWNVSNVEDMSYMFFNALSFNQPIRNWDVNSVKDTFCIFGDCPIKEEYKPKFRKCQRII